MDGPDSARPTGSAIQLGGGARNPPSAGHWSPRGLPSSLFVRRSFMRAACRVGCHVSVPTSCQLCARLVAPAAVLPPDRRQRVRCGAVGTGPEAVARARKAPLGGVPRARRRSRGAPKHPTLDPPRRPHLPPPNIRPSTRCVADTSRPRHIPPPTHPVPVTSRPDTSRPRHIPWPRHTRREHRGSSHERQPARPQRGASSARQAEVRSTASAEKTVRRRPRAQPEPPTVGALCSRRGLRQAPRAMRSRGREQRRIGLDRGAWQVQPVRVPARPDRRIARYPARGMQL
jgi:hypothetical protein